MQHYREIIDAVSLMILPLILVGLPVYGLIRRVPVYEAFVDGAKEGFTVAVRIIPYLVAILFAIAMFRASGAMDMLIELLRTPMAAIGIPPEILPMAIVRPLSGSGSTGVLLDLQKQFGSNSLITQIAGAIYGSSETTFYVIAVYFGSVGIKKTRHALPAGLIADVAGVFLATYIVKWLLW